MLTWLVRWLTCGIINMKWHYYHYIVIERYRLWQIMFSSRDISLPFCSFLILRFKIENHCKTSWCKMLLALELWGGALLCRIWFCVRTFNMFNNGGEDNRHQSFADTQNRTIPHPLVPRQDEQRGSGWECQTTWWAEQAFYNSSVVFGPKLCLTEEKNP